jgi:hypothetical protein
MMGAVGQGMVVSGGHAQAARPRSADYLTVADIDDVRAAWVNPAGLGRVLEASVMAEAVIDRPPADDLSLAQYTVGLNSRGFSVSYARDRTVSTAVVGMTRFGLGLPFTRGALGVAVTLYRGRGTPSHEGVDVGLGYRLTRTVDAAATVRNLNRPAMRGTELPVTGLVGASWRALPGRLTLGAEVAAADSVSGDLAFRYRGTMKISAPVGVNRLHLVSAVDVAGSQVDRWVIGVAVGTTDFLGALGGASRQRGLDDPDRFSLTALASRRAPGAVR